MVEIAGIYCNKENVLDMRNHMFFWLRFTWTGCVEQKMKNFEWEKE